jgi:uncharacterized protein involved in exopolysaccharide biosynthesis
MQKAGALENAPEVIRSPSIQRLKEMQASVLSRTAIMDAQAQAIASEIAAESARIVEGALAEARGWEQRESLLQQEIIKIRDEITRRRTEEFRAEDLKRNVAFNRAALEEALNKLRVQLTRAGSVRPDAEVIAEPVPPQTFASPNPFLTFLATLMVATLAGLAAARHVLLPLVRGRLQSSTSKRMSSP